MTTLKQITAHSYQQSHEAKENSTKQASSENRIQRLRRLIFPLTKPSVDQHGNTVQLWSIPESRVIAILRSLPVRMDLLATFESLNIQYPKGNHVAN
jgi:hypothetical protein